MRLRSIFEGVQSKQPRPDEVASTAATQQYIQSKKSSRSKKSPSVKTQDSTQNSLINTLWFYNNSDAV